MDRFRCVPSSKSCYGRFLSAVGQEWLGPVPQLIVPIFEAVRLVEHEGEIIAPGKCDGLTDDICQFAAFHVGIGCRDDIGAMWHCRRRDGSLTLEVAGGRSRPDLRRGWYASKTPALAMTTRSLLFLAVLVLASIELIAPL